jgi:hypothetical protein
MANTQHWSDDDLDDQELRRRFREFFKRQEVASYAESILKQRVESGGSCFMFAHSVGGLIGYAIRRLLVQFTEPRLISDELIRSLMSDYAFAPNWVPPRLLIREALAHAVHMRRLVEQLRIEVGGRENFEIVIEQAARDLFRADAAFLLNDEQVDAVIKTLR